jgi:bla regulator protein BlaR1
MNLSDLSSWVMWKPLANHLWQSTFFVGVIWLVTVALKNNRAAVRHWLWFAASVKFLVPFSLLAALGSTFAWRTVPATTQPVWSSVVENVAQPFAAAAPAVRTVAPHAWIPLPAILLCVWLCGVTIGVMFWLGCWSEMRTVRKKATPVALTLPIPVLSSPSQIEPGVFGIFRPTLLLPAGIESRLTSAQLNAILAHEMAHVRRRDNLTAAIHMLVETVFWFFPVIYWLRSRLLEEREHACDEEVLRLGGEPEQYAQGIIEICKSYVRSPVACVSGILGSELRRRIIRIAAQQTGARLTLFRKLVLCALGVAIVAAPAAFGVLNAPARAAESQQSAKLEFDVASIKPHKAAPGPFRVSMSIENDGINYTNVTVKNCIGRAYALRPYQISGGPSWMVDHRYDIVAKAGDPITKAQAMLMLQTLLADRFNLKFHIENKEMPIYSLVIAKGGPKIQQSKDDGSGVQIDADDQHPILARNISMSQFAGALSRLQDIDRPVIDRSGLQGAFNISLDFAPLDANSADSTGPAIVTAMQEQLGLKLEPDKAPADIFVIDHVEEPSAN